MAAINSSASERQKKILNLLEMNDSISINRLCEVFHVSAVTVRKDLAILEQQGLLQRVHGGAISSPANPKYSLSYRNSINKTEKMLIAKIASNMVKPQDAVLINAGSTCYFIANELKQKSDFFVITNSLAIMECFLHNRQISTLFLGGYINTNIMTSTGDTVLEQLSKYTINKLFIGMDAVDPIAGATSNNYGEDYIMKHMIAQAQESILVADGSKIGKSSLVKIADLCEFSTLITTETPQNKHVLNQISKLGINVIIAN